MTRISIPTLKCHFWFHLFCLICLIVFQQMLFFCAKIHYIQISGELWGIVFRCFHSTNEQKFLDCTCVGRSARKPKVSHNKQRPLYPLRLLAKQNSLKIVLGTLTGFSSIVKLVWICPHHVYKDLTCGVSKQLLWKCANL